MKSLLYKLICLSILSLTVAGCEREINTENLASFPENPDVFIDEFTSDLQYAAWGKVTSFDVDQKEVYSGTASMRIDVPDPNDPMGDYAGGNFYSTTGRNLSQYNALTFYAKSTVATEIEVGLGDGGQYRLSLTGLKLNTSWNKYIIPIPNSTKLIAETSLFYYAAGAVDGKGYTIWFDEVRFENLGTLAHAKIEDMEVAGFPGNISIGNLTYTVNLPNATNQQVTASASYFTFESSNPEIASVADNVITVHGNGEATITLKEAEGTIKVNGADLAPTPEVAPEKVISLFSDIYDNATTANWNPRWEYSTTEYAEINANGNKIAHYTNLNFVGIVFDSSINCNGMNYLHVDLLTLKDILPDSKFTVEVHNMPAGAAPNTMAYDVTTERLKKGEWISLDIPIQPLTDKSAIAQLVLSSVNLPDVYIDNVYFYVGEAAVVNEPTVEAPLPSHPAEDVVSIFSDSYENVSVATWSADWDNADVFETPINGNNVKKYAINAFAGIELAAPYVDVSSKSHIHLDVWVPEQITGNLNIKLVDFGADGVYGGGNDVEHELTLPTVSPGQWNAIDIPLTNFTNLTTKNHLAQILFIGNVPALYLDNIYFYDNNNNAGDSNIPTPPTHNYESNDILSIFGQYGTLAVNTWGGTPTGGNVSDFTIGGQIVKKYDMITCNDINFVDHKQDVSAMSYLHIDVYAPGNPSVLNIMLVNFGTEVKSSWVNLTPTSSPKMETDKWVSLDIPLSNFADLTDKSSIGQIMFNTGTNDLRILYVANIFFHK